MVLEKVIDIIAEELSVDPSEITEDSNLVEDLDADSLAVVDLVMSIEDAFNVEIPDTEVENLKTVGEIVQFIEENIRVSNFCALREIFRLVQNDMKTPGAAFWLFPVFFSLI